MQLLAFYGWILFVNRVWALDTTGQQNDIIPDQVLQIPYGMFCFFTMSELIFTDRMQQVAPSAYRVGAARLADMKVISTTSYSYQNLWGAYFFAQREDYSSIIQYAKSRDNTGFVSTMEIETIENEEGICVVTDIGLQPNTYLSNPDCSQCYGSGGSNNQPSAAQYRQELISLGVPASYFQSIGQQPGSQNPSAQMQGSSPNSSSGASGPKSPLGASAQANLSPNPSLSASATGPTPSLGASLQANPSQNPSLSASATGPTPSLGASLQANPSQNPSLSASATGPTPSLGAQATLPTQSPTGSLGTGLSAGVYQPRTNFSGGFGGGGGSSQQLSMPPGFTFASYSGQYSFLSASGGNSFMNFQPY